MKHTPGPWSVGEFSDTLGYDCMTAGIKAGPCVLDGSDYGQARCIEMNAEARSQMEADARLIAAAPDLLFQLLAASNYIDALGGDSKSYRQHIAKATGEQQ